MGSMKLLLGNSVSVVTGMEMDFQSPASIEFEDTSTTSEPPSGSWSAGGFTTPRLEEFCPAESLEWDESFEPAGAGALADWPL